MKSSTGGSQGKFIELNGLTLHYLDRGADKRGTIFTVHGWWDNAHTWDVFVDEFGSEFRIISLDSRGHGDSDWMPGGSYYPEDSVYDIAGLAESLEITDAIMVGHSFGGALSSMYTGSYPDRVRGVVLIEGIGPPKEEFRNLPGRLVRRREMIKKMRSKSAPVYATIEDVAARMRKSDPFVSEKIALHMAKHSTKPVEGGFTWKFDPLYKTFPPGGFIPQISEAFINKINVPVLLIIGKKSMFGNHPEMKERISWFNDIRVEHVDEAGHNVHLDNPKMFHSHVREFLEEIEKKEASAEKATTGTSA